MPDNKAVINEKEYELSPLRCKHLKQIASVLKERAGGKAAGLYSDIEVFMPFLGDSIRVKQPDFKDEELDELTLQGFNDAWTTLTKMSGVSLVKGEQKPAESTGGTSTAASASPSAGPILQ